jgi:hypothetical protein
MNASFYLFDVDHGQCAALQLPNGRWCVFDAGRTGSFSPIGWLATRSTAAEYSSLFAAADAFPAPFSIHKATISHLHGDHLADWRSLRLYGPDFLRTVNYDQDYLVDVQVSSASGSLGSLHAFVHDHATTFGPTQRVPDYGGAWISELELGVPVARHIGGSANSRVNNASVVTRIDCNGNSILLCGDMETDAWHFALTKSTHSDDWRRLVSNVDILVAPHHGHCAGFSPNLLSLARPRIVLVSIRSGDNHADARYSNSEFVRGEWINGELRRCITTRQREHIKLTIELSPGTSSLLDVLGGHGNRSWTFGDAAIGRNALLAALLGLNR